MACSILNMKRVFQQKEWGGNGGVQTPFPTVVAFFLDTNKHSFKRFGVLEFKKKCLIYWIAGLHRGLHLNAEYRVPILVLYFANVRLMTILNGKNYYFPFSNNLPEFSVQCVYIEHF